MSRLIDADALIKNYIVDEAKDDSEVISRADINNAPAVDAEPVRHGEWIRTDEADDYVECKCSVCSFKDYTPSYDVAYWIGRNYCPNCGAKMDGGGMSGE